MGLNGHKFRACNFDKNTSYPLVVKDHLNQYAIVCKFVCNIGTTQINCQKTFWSPQIVAQSNHNQLLDNIESYHCVQNQLNEGKLPNTSLMGPNWPYMVHFWEKKYCYSNKVTIECWIPFSSMSANSQRENHPTLWKMTKTSFLPPFQPLLAHLRTNNIFSTLTNIIYRMSYLPIIIHKNII